jgi:predicted nucleic acid-binding protein
MVASSLVVAEGHGWFLRRYDARRAVEFLRFIADVPALQIEKFEREELAKADRLIKKYVDQDLTLADAHGLALIYERRISTCWSTDRHLALTGAELAI